jgi:hypothetical protein
VKGHGDLGFVSGIGTYNQLQELTASRPDAYLEIEAAQTLNSSWFYPGSGNAYFHTWNESFDGETLDVVGVNVLNRDLTRVPSGLLGTTPWSYTFTMAPGGTLQLGVNLNGTSATSQNFRIDTVWRFCTGGMNRAQTIHPVFASELLTDVSFEDGLSNWVEAVTGAGWSSGADTGVVLNHGLSSLKLTSTGSAAGEVARRQTPTLASGVRARVFGYYMTPSNFPSTATAYVRVGTTTSMSSDGRDAESSLTDGLALKPTGGEVKTFFFDFISHEANPRIWFRLENSAATACSVYFDSVSCRQILYYAHYHPLIASDDALPEITQGSKTLYPGGEETGGGAVKILNRWPDFLERMFSPPWSINSRPMRIFSGGTFPNGQSVVTNDWLPAFAGVVYGEQPLSGDDTAAVIAVEDVRAILQARLPMSKYDNTGEVRDVGRPIPFVFGLKRFCRFSRRSFNSSFYGVYNTCDVTDWPDGVGGIGIVYDELYAYFDEDAALKDDVVKRVTLTDAKDYIRDEANGNFEIISDVTVIEITQDNNIIDFVTAGVTRQATIAPGFYIMGYGGATTGDRRGLLNAIRTAMATAHGSDQIYVYHDESAASHKIIFEYVGMGTFSLLWQSGAGKAKSLSGTLGYASAADDTGLTLYTGDTVIFDNVGGADGSHIIRGGVVGFVDDTAGTYTGISGGPITLGPDILRFILLHKFKLPSWRIDSASFALARISCARAHSIYLGSLGAVNGDGYEMTVQDFIDRLENSSFAEVVMDGSGVFFFKRRNTEVADNRPHLREHNYLSFRWFLKGTEIFRAIRVEYDKHPVTDAVQVWEEQVNDGITEQLHSAKEPYIVPTFLFTESDAQACAAEFEMLAAAPIRHFELSCRGMLMRTKVGDIIDLTRRRALQGVGETGGLDADQFRVMFIKKNVLNFKCTAIVHTNIAPDDGGIG